MRRAAKTDGAGRRGQNLAALGERTREQILAAAEHLFAERGPDSVSIRGIAAHADVSLSAINYHFGTKQNLSEELFRRLAVPINEERLQLLDQFIAAAENGTPSIHDVMYAFIAPPLRLVDESSGRARALVIMQFLSQSLSTPGEADIIETYYEPVRSRFIGIISTISPHLTTDEVLWRYNYVVGSIIYAMGGTTRMGRPPRSMSRASTISPLSGDKAIRQLVLFSAAGFSAPSTEAKP